MPAFELFDVGLTRNSAFLFAGVHISYECVQQLRTYNHVREVDDRGRDKNVVKFVGK